MGLFHVPYGALIIAETAIESQFPLIYTRLLAGGSRPRLIEEIRLPLQIGAFPRQP